MTSPVDEAAEPDVDAVEASPDEPPFALVQATGRCPTCDTPIAGHAAALSLDAAVRRAKGEQRERLALHFDAAHAQHAVVTAARDRMADAAIDLGTIAGVPDAGRARRLDSSVEREWIQLESLGGEHSFLPSELVLLRRPADPTLACREPTTSGAAHDRDPDVALSRAILELVERDAFMLAVVGRTTPRPLPAGGWQETLDWLSVRYRLEVRIFTLSSRLAFPAVMAVMVDRTGIGPAVTCGLACKADIDLAVEHALVEAWQPRTWLRVELPDGDTLDDPGLIRGALDRGRFWSARERVDQLSDLFRRANPELPDTTNSPSSTELCSVLARAGIRVFTHTAPRVAGGTCARIVSPDLLPFYLDERYRYTEPGSTVMPLPHFLL